jgi:ribonuclease Z
MTPTLHPRLLNGRAGDPGIFVEAMHAPGAVLFDCGDLSALANGHLLRVELLCVSHAHMDHWADFDRLLRPLIGREALVRVVGPPGFATHLHHRLGSYIWNLVDRIAAPLSFEVTEVTAAPPFPTARLRLQRGFAREDLAPVMPAPDGTLLRMGPIGLRAAVLDHGTPSIGYALVEDRHLNVWRSRLAERGLAAGRWLAALKQAIADGLPDDAVIAMPAGAQPLGALRDLVVATPGQRIAYLTDFGDTPANRAAAVALAQGADTLFIEAPFLAADSAIAADRMHLTTRAAGEIARAARVRRVEPFHLSPRYTGREAEWLAEVEAAFGAPLTP